MLRLIFVIILLLIGWNVASDFPIDDWKSRVQQIVPEEILTSFSEMKEDIPLESKKTNIEVNRAISIYQIPIGVASTEVETHLGKPNRIEPSGFGFDWWVYNGDLSNYVQVGMMNGRVNTVYSNGSNLSVGNLVRGDSYSLLAETFSLQKSFDVKYDGATFSIVQNEVDMTEHPIVMDGSVAIQFFIDVHDQNRITAIQLMDIPTMIKIGNAAISYRYIGTPPNITVPTLNFEQQKLVNEAHEKQILDLANTVRVRAGLSTLSWNGEAAVVARSHSVDMKDNHFFDHESPSTGSPFDRLENAGVEYVSAGENIAMGYRTAVSVHEGWMNSKGHRDNILKPQFRTLGVGALNDYYTQNFVTYGE